MPIVTYTPIHADAVVALYNAMAAPLPYCSPMDRTWFTDVITAKHTFSPDLLWLFEEGGQAIGYIQCSFLSESADEITLNRLVAGIDALCFTPNRLDVGEQLIAAALDYLGRQGTREVGFWFNTGYPLYRGIWCGLEPAGCVSGAAHARQALERAGFYLQQTSHLWLVEMSGPPALVTSRLPVECRVAPHEFISLAERDSWRGIAVREASAWLDGQQVGLCLFAELPGYREHRGYAAGCIGSLSVNSAMRRSGIASLLVSETMRDLYTVGVRQVWVATQAFNIAAHFTYERMGFRRFAEIHVMGREL